MTREELLTEYLKDKFKYLIEDNEGNIINITKKVKEALCAGFEADRPKWHNVAKKALPNNCRYVWTNVGAGYYDGDCWRDAFGKLQGVIAWCEPNFDEVEERMTDEELAEKYADSYNIMNKDLSPKSPRHIVKEAFLNGLKVGETMQVEQIKDISDERLELILYRLKDLGVIKSWYYNGTYHAC